MDGITGVCHVPLGTVPEATAFYGPLASVVLFAAGVALCRRRGVNDTADGAKQRPSVVPIATAALCLLATLFAHATYEWSPTAELALVERKVS